MRHALIIRPSLLILAAALSAMTVSACGQNNGGTAAAAPPPPLPLTTGAATAPVLAPAGAALPAAPAPKIVRVASQSDQYAYVDQAQAFGAALGSAPPDYGFDYDGVRPWVWRASDNSARLVEPVEGGYRYYYFRPGAPYPYFIQDPQYGYGFNGEELVVVYDARGNALPPRYADLQADYAGRYLARARALYEASLQNERRSVIAANWAARQQAIDAQQAEWASARAQDDAWRAYHDAHEAEIQSYWQAEQARRDAAAQQFNTWRDADYRGPPPPPPAYAPVAGVAGAALVGGVIGGLLAGRDHHDHGAAPPPTNGPGPGYAGQGPAFDQGARDHGPQNAQRQEAPPYKAEQAQRMPTEPAPQQQAASERQAEQTQRAQADQARQQQALAQRQAEQTQRAQADQVRQQQALAQRQADQTQRAQADQARQQQAASQRQAKQAQDAQLRQQQAADQRQVQAAARAQAAQQQAAQRQTQDAQRAQVLQARQQQATAQRQAQAAAHVQASAAAPAARAPHPGAPPHPTGGRHEPHPGDPAHPTP
jgi:hypothetical protein